MLDIDQPKGAPPSVSELLPEDPDGLRDLLIEVIPGLADAPMAWATSSSSCVYRNGEELVGVSGQRFYVLLQRGIDVEAFVDALKVGLANRRLVWCLVSSSGQRLVRYPLDFAVFQPERLDFAAPPKLSGGLESRPPGYRVWNEGGQPLSRGGIPSPSPAERAKAKNAVEARKREKATESEKAKSQWEVQTVKRLAEQGHVSQEVHRGMIDAAVDKGILLGGWPLKDSAGRTVTVRELLSDPGGQHGREFCDPIEPDYRGDTRIAVFLAGDDGRCRIYSHAHGGQTWLCVDRLAVIPIGTTDETFEAVRAALAEDSCGMYRKGQSIVAVNEADGSLKRLEPEGIALRLQTRFQVIKATQNGDRPSDLPVRLIKTLMAEPHLLPLPKLTSVVAGPFARRDLSTVSTPGYDPDSEALVLSGSFSLHGVSSDPADDELTAAFEAVWAPLSEFAFAAELDQAVVLAAIFNAVTRPSMRKAPGYLVSAPTPGSGKTTLAEYLGALQTGKPPITGSLPPDESEVRKKLFAAVMGGQDFVLFDNLERGRPLDSSTIANYLTSESIEDRVLGESRTESHPNRMTMVFTGNNASLVGDLSRRIATITLDRRVEKPWETRYSGPLPMDLVLADFSTYRAAVLTLLRRFDAAGRPTPDTASGYPDWDLLCRAPAIWALKTFTGASADPIDALREAYEEDVESDDLGALLEAIHSVFGSTEVLARDMLSEAERVVSEAPEDEFDERPERLHLARALDDIVPQGTKRRSTALGRYLDGQENRVVTGLQLQKAGKKQNSTLWKVCPVEVGLDG